ncbi:MAG: YscD/HrpQ family type secretion apparatus protein [Variovorax sp.]|nr:YscD/HrpQ family type secretion apparatus protein [Variovorax sp.]
MTLFDPGLPITLTLEEVRVLNGLSRGAAIPIESRLSVGCSPENDLVLLDPLVSEQEAELECPLMPGGPLIVRWLNTPAPGAEPSTDEPPIVREAQIALGDVFIVSGVTLQYCNSDAPWDYALLPKVDPAKLPRIGRKRRQVRRAPTLKLRIFQGVMGLGLIALIGIAALMFFQRQNQSKVLVQSAVPKAAGLTASQVASELQFEMESRGLTTLQATVDRGIVHVIGTVPASRQEEFERVVERARATYRKTRFRFETTNEAAPGPALDIVAIVGGATPNLLLRDGSQLYVGSALMGFTLSGIEGSCAILLAADNVSKATQCLGASKPPGAPQ